MRNDKLWQDDDVQKALAILKYYQNEEAKVLFTTSGENYDGMPPNHQNKSDLSEDSKTLRIGSAWDYCHWVNKAVRIMKQRHYPNYAQMINDWYLRGNRLSINKELIRLQELIKLPKFNNRISFYENLPKAILRFSIECPTFEFNQLYRYELKNNKRG